MLKKVLRPVDPYDVSAWALFWEQNPNTHRGVGSDGVNDDVGDNGDKGNNEQDPTKASAGEKQPENKDSGDNKPSDAEAKLIKEVMDKKAKLKSTSEELDKIKGQLKQFEGIDLEQIKTLLAAQQAAKDKELEDKHEWDALKTQMVTQHNAALQELKDALDAEKGNTTKLGGTINDLTIGHSFDSSNFISEDLHLTSSKARIIYGSHFAMEGGKIIAYDKPTSDSSRTMLVDGQGEPLTFDAAIRKIIDADPDRDHVVKSKIKPGSDSKPKDKGKPNAPELKGASKIEAALSAGK